ncbi:hypothetical protein PIROE2DRAFT_17643 [Piromyces sp. E2]|nr:hypothetical protein PIROE2DRAFT_17643 [Piromyces sp. E2]|eukprot:OUM57391.1 hypothetical protein PIROE2DRAFT_17643 [Piromyces sp. E2]
MIICIPFDKIINIKSIVFISSAFTIIIIKVKCVKERQIILELLVYYSDEKNH